MVVVADSNATAATPTSGGTITNVGGAGGGGGNNGGGTNQQQHDSYYDYYTPEHYYMHPPDMCPQHPQMCAIHSEYGSVPMPVVTSATLLPAGMLPPVLDESGNMRHYHVMTHPPPPPPPHHQPHYGPANGNGVPQQFYHGPYPSHHYHHHHVHGPPAPPPHHVQHSPPPPPPHSYHKDERTQRQHTKLKKKLEHKLNSQQRNNGLANPETNSGHNTPSLSPRKDILVNGHRGNGTTTAWSEGDSSSATTSVQDQDDNLQNLLDMLSAAKIPSVTEITPFSALVNWNTPMPAGLTLPKGELSYQLLLRHSTNQYKPIYNGQSLSCRVRDLTPGMEYLVCLQVQCGDFIGAASAPMSFCAPPAPPGQPKSLTLKFKGRNAFVIRWGVAAEHGSHITHYCLEMDVGGGFIEIARPRTRHHTVSDLSPATLHRFRVAAINDCGRGDWSEEACEWTPGAAPGPCSPPTLEQASPHSLTFIWEASPMPHEEFTLQLREESSPHGFMAVYSGPETRYVCEDLVRAAAYRVRLRRESCDGAAGPWSQEVGARTLPERPFPPSRLQAKGKIHSRAFRLRWEPPSDDGGSPVRSYSVQLDEGQGFGDVYCGSEREANCDRLKPGTLYRARVNCTTDGGTSDWSATETIATEPVCPSACTSPHLVAEPKARFASVRWKPPDCNGGAAISSYKLEIKELDGSCKLVYEGPDLHAGIVDLEPGQQYEIWVFACNKVGYGPKSPSTIFRTAPAPPESPDAPTLQTLSPNCVHISWTEPNGNGATITEYHLEMSLIDDDSSYTIIYRGNSTEHTAEALTPFTPYFFRVCAKSIAGRGQPSPAAATITPASSPAPPTTVKHVATANSMTITWKQPADHGSPIQKYLVEIDGHNYETEGADCEYSIEDLKPDTGYRVRVSGINEVGVGQPSSAVELRTRPPPPAPPVLSCIQQAHNFIKLKWDDTEPGRDLEYRLEMRGPESRDFRLVYKGSARTFKAKKLREETPYLFRIWACDERGGKGPVGPAVKFTTLSAPPPPPRPLLVDAPTSRAALIRWDPVPSATDYTVQWGRGKDALRSVRVPDPELRLEDLEAAAEYSLRVCACRDGIQGTWSTPLKLQTPAHQHITTVASAVGPARTKRGRTAHRLGERHAALLLAVGLVVIAVLVAVGVETLVDWRGP